MTTDIEKVDIFHQVIFSESSRKGAAGFVIPHSAYSPGP